MDVALYRKKNEIKYLLKRMDIPLKNVFMISQRVILLVPEEIHILITDVEFPKYLEAALYEIVGKSVKISTAKQLKNLMYYNYKQYTSDQLEANKILISSVFKRGKQWKKWCDRIAKSIKNQELSNIKDLTEVSLMTESQKNALFSIGKYYQKIMQDSKDILYEGTLYKAFSKEEQQLITKASVWDLHNAISENQKEIVEYWLNHETPEIILKQNTSNVMQEAITKRNNDMMKLLLEYISEHKDIGMYLKIKDNHEMDCWDIASFFNIEDDLKIIVNEVEETITDPREF